MRKQLVSVTSLIVLCLHIFTFYCHSHDDNNCQSYRDAYEAAKKAREEAWKDKEAAGRTVFWSGLGGAGGGAFSGGPIGMAIGVGISLAATYPGYMRAMEKYTDAVIALRAATDALQDCLDNLGQDNNSNIQDGGNDEARRDEESSS